jgi:2,3-dihydroxybenzoate decarboxylase
MIWSGGRRNDGRSVWRITGEAGSMQGKIALEEHFSIEETLGDSAKFKLPGWQDLRDRLLDFQDMRLGEMDKHGIEFAIQSLNAPAIQSFLDTETAVANSIIANDLLAAEVAKRPDRFAGFAALPMQDPDQAARELNRCIKELGFVGALVNGFSQRDTPDNILMYDRPEYRPFWAEVAALDVPFYLHPRDPVVDAGYHYQDHPWFTGPVWGFAAETGIHALRLIASGIFDDHPNLTVILGHLGEHIPYDRWRIDHRLNKTRGDMKARRPFGDYLKQNFYLTTSGNFSTNTLTCAIAELGADRILFSVDYPFEITSDATDWYDGLDTLPKDVKQAIGRGNAIKLFDLDLS